MMLQKPFLILLLSLPLASAEPFSNLVTVEDGLDVENPESVQDDFIRLTLITPDYGTANAVRQRIEQWLGPDMVSIRDSGTLRVQAPRDPSARVTFIAALLELDTAH